MNIGSSIASIFPYVYFLLFLCRAPAETPVRILNASMFESPPRTFELPSYACALAQQFVDAPSPPYSRPCHVADHVLKFLDVEAGEGVESDGEDSGDEDSSTSN